MGVGDYILNLCILIMCKVQKVFFFFLQKGVDVVEVAVATAISTEKDNAYLKGFINKVCHIFISLHVTRELMQPLVCNS